MDSFFRSLWDRTPHSFKWLIEVVAGEFWEDRDTSAMVADMLASFVPGVIIVTSARDLLAVIYHMGRDPKRREEVTQWMLLIACIIPLILPLLGAAAGFAAAGVGSIVGAIGGSEVGALLRAVCLVLIERSGAILTRVVEFLRTFIHGDIIAVLKDVKFAQYGAKIGEAVEKIIAQFVVILKKIRGELGLLRYLDPYGKVEAALSRLQELEEGFYSVQLMAAHKIPLALAELDNRLAKLLTEDMAALEHAVHPGFPAPKPKIVPHEPVRVPAMSDNPLGRPNGTTTVDVPPSTEPKTNLHPQTVAKPLHRPYIRQGVRREVEARAERTADGRFIDPNTHQPIDGPYDLGHAPGHEFWREQQKAAQEGLTQEQFNDRMNNPDYYQIEDPSSNRSHQFEQKDY